MIPSTAKPSDLSFTPVIDTLVSHDVSDADDDIITNLSEKNAGAVTLNWYYKNGVTETALTVAQQNETFCSLAASGVVPYIQIKGNITLRTQYGDPVKQDYPDIAISITKIPKRNFSIGAMLNAGVCYAKPDMKYARAQYAGPISQWDGGTTGGTGTQSNGKGFIPQPSGQDNFPTTGANGLFFDLSISGADASTLTWPPVTVGNVTANMSVINATTVRVTLDGPKASSIAIGATAAGFTPSLIQLKGVDSGGTALINYNFNLKKWYVNRGNVGSASRPLTNWDGSTPDNQFDWCSNLNTGIYRVPNLLELTNSNGSGWSGGTSSGNYYQRTIGGGLFSEWGTLGNYSGAGFVDLGHWTADTTGSNFYYSYANNGVMGSAVPSVKYYVICVTN